MKKDRPEVLVIGGGATGAGVARDLAMRGADVLLAEAGDFASGATGGNHGMLHSGARYAVKDPSSARECAVESAILKRIAAFCIEDCGGLFASLPSDDPAYPSRLLSCCRSTGVEARELDIKEALRCEPNLNEDIVAAVEVPDASMDPFFLVWGNVLSARRAGAVVRNHLPVRDITVEGGSITNVAVGDGKDRQVVRPEVVVNAAGAWCERVAAMASVELPMQMDRGTMVLFNGRLVNGLVNRMRSPSDGDILVPHRSSTILGTTSGPGQVDSIHARREEVESLVREARALLPGVGGARMVRAYAGIRPLPVDGSQGRETSRGFRIIGHGSDIDNMVSVVGGKLTTYRLMAEKASDEVMAMLGRKASCRTSQEELVPPPRLPMSSFHLRVLGSRYGGLADEVIAAGSQMEGEEACSCEAVTYAELEHFAATSDVRDLGDLMRRTRAGMGFCQAGMCAFRMASVLGGDPIDQAERYLRSRWKGIEPVLEGNQLGQEAFKAHLLRVYGIDHTTGGRR